MRLRTGNAKGYTLVMCTAPPCRDELTAQIVATLRECVRTSRCGVLVMSQCTLGTIACRLRPPGQFVLVQPCDTQRRPMGSGVRVGPLRDEADLAAVQAWIRAARFDAQLLLAHLTATDRTVRSAMRN
ncbi:hypothetical protein [Pseudonocardia sp.]|uniref:hypothetical protein n=1 Tax=Pseudonocardia sp. TaxID=60912 RepID=UPI0031FDACF8